MKKYIKIILVTFLFLVNSGLLFGQQLWLELGDKYFDQFDYNKALKLYSGAIDRGIDNWEIHARLGDCYFFTLKFDKAVDKYEDAFKKISDTSASYILKYARSLQSAGIKGFNEEFEHYKRKIGNKNYKIEDFHGFNLPIPIKLENLSINTEYSDFGTFIYQNTLYFSSSRENPNKPRRFNKRLYKWNGQPFLDIYTAAIIRNGNTDSLKLISPDSSTVRKLNTVAHEGSVTISNSGNTMYFSRGVLKKEKNKMDYNKQGTSNLKLRRATLVNNSWEVTPSDSLALEFLDFEYFSIGNPALSPDGKRLFFVSCAPFPEAKGQSDIYYINIDSNGDLDKRNIKNVPGINTNDRQSFPFVSNDGTLYFSSNAIYNDTLGLGLMDIYKLKDINNFIDNAISKKNDTTFIKNYIEKNLSHLTEPFNSPMDDFAYFEEPTDDNECEIYTYFSSNWEGHPNVKGDDDIYRVKMKKNRTIIGTIINSFTQKPLENASVDLIEDASGKILNTIQVDSTGTYKFDVEFCQTYSLRGYKDRYYNDVETSNSKVAIDTVNLELKPYPCEITVDHIIFDSNSYNIKDDEKKALSELLEILLANPDIRVKIEAFTDSFGTDEYNLRLSGCRAKASKKYLINAGVSESQIISAKGFGENCPLITDEDIKNITTDDEKCEAHKMNRRTRFIFEYCNVSLKVCKEVDSIDADEIDESEDCNFSNQIINCPPKGQ